MVDHDTFIYNLTRANELKTDHPEWFKSYSFKSAYGVPNLSPASLDGLLTTFANDHQKFYKYWQRSVKYADTALAQSCDNWCLHWELCEPVRTEFGAISERCDQLSTIFWRNANI